MIRTAAGIVYIVGAGPGDPELITVRGRRMLRRSDVVVYDRLVHPALVRRARAGAERVFVGKTPGHGVRQDTINALLIDRARRGLRVTRLKGGDPFVFGRGGEEAEALRAAGVRFEIVPGITSAVAVPAYAGIPVTHRRLASAFAVVTGHECAGASDLDWSALARIPTLVVLMGHRALGAVAARLLTHGAGPDMPAAVVSRGTTPNQRTVVSRLQDIAAAAALARLEEPSVLIVGEVARLHDALEWCTPDAALQPTAEARSG
ncbi:MAG TPA: uroporphyrinogen-III C-methyltransferase [bacterium]|nr:uroporphyrinogen-III C-methyltransferase [bacterium]